MRVAEGPWIEATPFTTRRDRGFAAFLTPSCRDRCIRYYQLIKDFSLAHFVRADGLLDKPAKAPCGFVTPTPTGVQCGLSDLIDWPEGARDGSVLLATTATVAVAHDTPPFTRQRRCTCGRGGA